MEINRANSQFLLTLLHHSTLHGPFNHNVFISPFTKIKTRVKPKPGKKRASKCITVYDIAMPFPSSTLSKSPPTSAAFFGVYNKTKTKLEHHAYSENLNQSICHILAVYMGHTASCLIRVPVDVVKQQAKVEPSLTTFQTINKLVCSEGIHRRLVKQLLTTLVRELPFCSIKFPLWEFLKVTVENKKKNKQIETYESAICGSIAGGTAAGLTMPIDLAYKRINVDKNDKYTRWKLYYTIKEMAREKGIKGLYAGVFNRVPMIAFGGFLFFFGYEQKKRVLYDDE